MTQNNETHPDQVHEIPQSSVVEEPEPSRRAVPNIPRREPDSLPERPERSGSSGSSGTLLMLVLIVILALVLFWLRK